MDVVLPERVDPDVLLERVDGVLAEPAGHLVGRRVQLAEEATEEAGTVLDRRHAQVREAHEQLVADERRQEVLDGPLELRELDGLGDAALEVGREPVVRVAVGRVARIAGVHDHGDAGLVGQRPERIEIGVGGRLLSVAGRRRRRTHHDRAGAVVEAVAQLGDRGVDVGEADVGRREDAVLVLEAPVLGDPPVERLECHGDRFGVVLELLLVDHAEGREHPDGVEPVVVELVEADVTVAVCRGDAVAGLEELDGVVAVGVAPEVVAQHTGLRHRIERGVDHRTADPAADDVVHPPVDLGPLDRARAPLGGQVPAEGVERLVVVVVGVEGPRCRCGEIGGGVAHTCSLLPSGP